MLKDKTYNCRELFINSSLHLLNFYNYLQHEKVEKLFFKKKGNNVGEIKKNDYLCGVN